MFLRIIQFECRLTACIKGERGVAEVWLIYLVGISLFFDFDFGGINCFSHLKH